MHRRDAAWTRCLFAQAWLASLVRNHLSLKRQMPCSIPMGDIQPMCISVNLRLNSGPSDAFGGSSPQQPPRKRHTTVAALRAGSLHVHGRPSGCSPRSVGASPARPQKVPPGSRRASAATLVLQLSFWGLTRLSVRLSQIRCSLFQACLGLRNVCLRQYGQAPQGKLQ